MCCSSTVSEFLFEHEQDELRDLNLLIYRTCLAKMSVTCAHLFGSLY